MDELTRRRRARSFGPVADTYARVRPGYPPDAIAWLLPNGAERVLDMGAGTGALTRSLVDAGLEVVAVEPDAAMRRVLASRVPEADVREGSAESLPVEDASVDAVVGGQMWHWVDTAAAVPEVARALRPGGTLGLLWNLRDEHVPWMRELGAIMGGEDRAGSIDRPMSLPAGSPFDGSAVRQFTWRQDLAPSDLVDFVATRSHVRLLDEAERNVLLARVQELVDTHPDLAGRRVVEVPYLTTCFRAMRRTGS